MTLPTDTTAAAEATARTTIWGVIPPVVIVGLAGGLVSLSLGFYAQLHDPAARQTISLVFSNTLALKAWFTTGAALLAGFQLYSALRFWGKVSRPRRIPPWFGDAHRLSGTLALVLTLPVAYHCLWALGFDFTDTAGQGRRLVHSLLGCFFYGAFAAKMLVLRGPRTPGWALPVLGGAVVTALVGIWFTTSLWYFTNVSFPGF